MTKKQISDARAQCPGEAVSWAKALAYAPSYMTPKQISNTARKTPSAAIKYAAAYMAYEQLITATKLDQHAAFTYAPAHLKQREITRLLLRSTQAALMRAANHINPAQLHHIAMSETNNDDAILHATARMRCVNTKISANLAAE